MSTPAGASRRKFIANATAAAAALSSGLASAAARPEKDDISLAAWSINRSFFIGNKWENLDLPRICRDDFGINGIEFVNQFFENPTLGYLKQLKRAGDDHGVKYVLIMCDHEGDMASADKTERMNSARAHRKWIDVGHYLGCHAIRCNLGGPRPFAGQEAEIVKRSAESFSDLLEYARTAEMNVVIENHGGASSDPDVLVALMEEVNDPDFGTLPDFGNVNPGADHYEVIRRLVPYAKGISVKAAWTNNGTHPGYDLEKLLRICLDAGYHGFWGIESSLSRTGDRRKDRQLPIDQIWEDEKRGVMLTKSVIEKVILKKG